MALTIIVLGAIWVDLSWVTTMLVTLVAVLAGIEGARLFSSVAGRLPEGFVGVASALAALAAAGVPGPASEALLILILVLILGMGAVTLALGPPAPEALSRASALMMVPLYVGLPLGLFAWLRDTSGPAAVTWVIAVVAISDSAQYFSGRAFGRRKLAPAVSPAKTVEGALGGLIVVVAFGGLTSSLVTTGGPAVGAGLALSLAAAGIVGDLFESLLKRSAGVKDSSTLIPGHGGVLDRIDSHLFAAPAFYVFQRFMA